MVMVRKTLKEGGGGGLDSTPPGLHRFEFRFRNSFKFIHHPLYITDYKMETESGDYKMPMKRQLVLLTMTCRPADLRFTLAVP